MLILSIRDPYSRKKKNGTIKSGRASKLKTIQHSHLFSFFANSTNPCIAGRIKNFVSGITFIEADGTRGSLFVITCSGKKIVTAWKRVGKEFEKKRKGGNFPSHRITNDPPRVKFNASSKQKRGRLGAGSSLLTPVAAKRRVMKFAVVFSQRRNRSLSVPFSFSLSPSLSPRSTKPKRPWIHHCA